MQNIGAVWLYPLILVAGALQAWGPPLGGLLGAVAVIKGLLFVDKIGAGPFAGLTITANILMSLVIDHYGLFGIEQHSLNMWRILGGALMTGGIVLVAMF